MQVETIKTVGENVLVCLDKRKTESDGGIIIPENAAEVPMEGTVHSVGGRVKHLDKGMKVGIPKHSGTLFGHVGAEWVIIEEPKVLYVRS